MKRNPHFFDGKVAVVTGAASGIGRELTLELVRRGAKVAASDVDTAGLAETEVLARHLTSDPEQTLKFDHLNVTEHERFEEYAADVVGHFGTVNLIFNNAGIAFTGDIEAMTHKQIEQVHDVDYWGVVNGTKAFLPHLIASGDGHVVNISSVFGIISVPTQGAYNAAKFAVRGFTEALRMEMLARKRPVKVTCVHPGGIKTAVARNAGAVDGLDAGEFAQTFDKMLARMEPDKAARIILKGVEKGKARVLVGADAYAIDGFARLTGARYQRVVGFVSRKAGL